MAGTYDFIIVGGGSAGSVLAIVIYVVARVVRNRQGVDLSLINKEIPVE